MMTEKVLINAGYKQAPVPVVEQYANRFFQKKIKDEKGIKYFIDVYEYEISDEYIETICKKEDSNVFKPKIDKNKMMNEDNDLHPGDMVNHDKYGFGVVVTIDGSIATISFKRDGLKKLMKNHKSIHKM